MGKGWSMSSVLLSSAYGERVVHVECATEFSAYGERVVHVECATEFCLWEKSGPCRVCY